MIKKEAIKAVLEPLGIGYVANSPYTVLELHCRKIMIKIGKQAIGTIKIVTGNGISVR